MKEIINASLLISGTAIGAGLIALPIMAANLGVKISLAFVIAMVFVAYQSSMMTLDLNDLNGKSDSIVEMSNKLSGRGAFLVTLLSFYMLSISLLTAYFAGITDSIVTFFSIKNSSLAALLCGLGLYAILYLKSEAFSKLNSVLVVILLIVIMISLIKIHTSQKVIFPQAVLSKSEFFAFLPIIFTSFGVQNICPYIHHYLKKDRKKINLSFLIGIIIPAIVYIVWIYFVFENILSRDIIFFERLQNHQVSAGELVKFLCESSNSALIDVVLKILSLFAMITSAIGIGLGLVKSINEIAAPSPRLAGIIVCIIPVMIVLITPDTFISVLSFGGIIATIFVIFTPYFLLFKHKTGTKMKIKYNICLACGVIIAACELLRHI